MSDEDWFCLNHLSQWTKRFSICIVQFLQTTWQMSWKFKYRGLMGLILVHTFTHRYPQDLRKCAHLQTYTLSAHTVGVMYMFTISTLSKRQCKTRCYFFKCNCFPISFFTHTHTHTHTHTTETVICGDWDKKQDKAIQLRHNTRDINDGSYDISWFIYIYIPIHIHDLTQYRYIWATCLVPDCSGIHLWSQEQVTQVSSSYTQQRNTHERHVYLWKKNKPKKNGLEYTCYHTNHIMYLTHMSIPG